MQIGDEDECVHIVYLIFLVALEISLVGSARPFMFMFICCYFTKSGD